MELEIVERREFVTTKPRPRNAKISLDEYLQYIDSHNHSDLSINYLNQIISMHGFKKIHKTPKVILTSAMSSIAVVNPRRSTLRLKISPAEIGESLESIVKDLNELNWQECSISSVEAIVAEYKSNKNFSSSASASVLAQASAKPAPKSRRTSGESNRRAPKPKKESKRRALKPKENGASMTCVSEEGNGAKRAKKRVSMKKKCGCNGCVNQGSCSFVW